MTSTWMRLSNDGESRNVEASLVMRVIHITPPPVKWAHESRRCFFHLNRAVPRSGDCGALE